MKQVAKVAFVSIDGTDISNSADTISLGRTRGNGEITAFGDPWEIFAAGLKAMTFSLGMFQDYDAGAIESLLRPLFEAEPTVASVIVVRQNAAAVSTSNPEYTFSAFITDLPIDLTLKSVNKMTVTFSNTSDLVTTTA